MTRPHRYVSAGTEGISVAFGDAQGYLYLPSWRGCREEALPQLGTMGLAVPFSDAAVESRNVV